MIHAWDWAYCQASKTDFISKEEGVGEIDKW
jgi:hypothetical protein